MQRAEPSLEAVLTTLDFVLGGVLEAKTVSTVIVHKDDSAVRYTDLSILLEEVFAPGELDVDVGTNQPKK